MGNRRSTLLAQLADILADLYPFREDILTIVRAVGLRPAMIQFDTRAVNTWTSVVYEADAHRTLGDLIAAAQRDYPEHPGLALAAAGRLTAVRGPEPRWRAQTPEKTIGPRTLLPVWFLERGWELARAVGRIQLANGELGTGFLIAPDLLLTNHHVLPTGDAAATAELQLNVQVARSGRIEPTHPCALDPARGFATHAEHDWTAVRLAQPAGAPWGHIEVAPRRVAARDSVFIIQHPLGEPKQVAFGLNEVAFVGDGLVQYLTDTMPGSSGSPVFDREWRLVALHHSGGWVKEGAGGRERYQNEGIHVDVVHADLVAAGLVP